MFLRNRSRILIPAVFIGLMSACSKPEPLKVMLQGDTLTSVAKLEFPGGITTAECGFTVNAVATGEEGDSARLGKGTIVYTMQATGDTMITRPIEAATVASFWEGDQAVVSAGSSLTSKRQGISVSLPVQPLRALVSFEYTGTDGSATQTTEPFAVVCR